MYKTNMERLHLFQKVEEMLKEMIRKEVKECSEATERCMKHIFKLLRNYLYHLEVARIERLKEEKKISPKEAVHRKALLRRRRR